MIRREAMGYAVMMFVMGLILSGVDNYAHAGGFAGGYVTGMWLDPLKRERMDHLVGAAICVGLTALALLSPALPFWPLIMQMFGRLRRSWLKRANPSGLLRLQPDLCSR